MSSVRSAGRSGIFLRMRLRRGLVLGEVLVLVAMLAILGMLALVALGDGRRAARLGQCQANLRFYGMMTPTYAGDNSDLDWGFSWGLENTDNPFGSAHSLLQAHADQAVWILNRLGGPVGEDIGRASGWVPSPMYGILPLADYAGRGLPDPQAVCPSDINRAKWNRDPEGFQRGEYRPSPPPTSSRLRWAFSSTYMRGIAWWDRTVTPTHRVTYDLSYNQYDITTQSALGQARLTDVQFPSSKVALYEQHSFHAGSTRQAYVDYPEARVSVLAADGSCRVQATSESNPGWRPRTPTSPLPTQVNFNWPTNTNERWYPGPLNGELSEVVNVAYGLTRGGLAGRDFDGPPAETGQP